MKQLEKFINYITEELKDIPANVKNVHYTNLPALISMLKDGYIKGQHYMVNTGRNSEVATARPTKTNTSKDELSGSVDNVKIALFTDRIKAGVHGAKVKPIAEYPQESIKGLKYQENELKNKYGLSSLPEFPKGFCSKWSGMAANMGEVIPDEKIMRQWIVKNLQPKASELEDIAHEFCRYYRGKCNLNRELIQREGEERISVGEKGIPLDPRFMKIEFTDMPDYAYWEDFYDPQDNHDKDYLKIVYDKCDNAIKTLNASSPELVVRNNYFNKIIMQLMMWKKRAAMALKNPAK